MSILGREREDIRLQLESKAIIATKTHAFNVDHVVMILWEKERKKVISLILTHFFLCFSLSMSKHHSLSSADSPSLTLSSLLSRPLTLYLTLYLSTSLTSQNRHGMYSGKLVLTSQEVAALLWTLPQLADQPRRSFPKNLPILNENRRRRVHLFWKYFRTQRLQSYLGL